MIPDGWEVDAWVVLQGVFGFKFGNIMIRVACGM